MLCPANQMILWRVREGDFPINENIISLIINARMEMLAAREAGHRTIEDFWRVTMDRFLDAYASGASSAPGPTNRTSE